MEEITDGVNNMNLAVDSQKKNRIQVSNTKKPLFFYVNLAKSVEPDGESYRITWKQNVCRTS